VADVTLSDSIQAWAPAPYKPPTGPALKGKIVGVVPFVFVCSPGTTTTSGTVTNLTSTNAKKLLGGTLLLSNLTGKSGDSGVHVYAVGRDQDSGTRIATLADTGYGIAKDDFQYQPLYNGATTPTSPPPTPSGSITGAALWPATPPVDSVNSPTGDSGYNSGSLVAASIAQTFIHQLVHRLGWFERCPYCAGQREELRVEIQRWFLDRDRRCLGRFWS
jgi:hypothetical protein